MAAYHIFWVVLIVLHFIAFAITVVGTPLAVYTLKNHTVLGINSCFTLWGFFTKCYDYDDYVNLDKTWGGCRERRELFRGAEACSIVAILMFLLSFIFSIFGCFCSCIKKVCILWNLLGAAGTCVVCVIVLDSFNHARGPTVNPLCNAIRHIPLFTFSLGPGFILFVIASGIGFLNTFLSLFTLCG